MAEMKESVITSDFTLRYRVAWPSTNSILKCLPVWLILALTIFVAVWNSSLGITLQPKIPLVLVGLSALLLLISGYTWFRQAPVLSESTFYSGLWFSYPMTGIKLTYLGVLAGFPLQDQMFVRWDAALGFDWLGWTNFVVSHPWLQQFQELVYGSHTWQPIVTIAVLARWGRPGSNCELLTSLLLGMMLVAAVAMFLPAIGPSEAHGFPTAIGNVFRLLHAGDVTSMPSLGIVAFPSLHTVMAILFTLAHRNLPTFVPMLILNGIMLTAIPVCGDHYLVDMLGGGMIAIFALWLARRVLSGVVWEPASADR